MYNKWISPPVVNLVLTSSLRELVHGLSGEKELCAILSENDMTTDSKARFTAHRRCGEGSTPASTGPPPPHWMQVTYPAFVECRIIAPDGTILMGASFVYGSSLMPESSSITGTIRADDIKKQWGFVFESKNMDHFERLTLEFLNTPENKSPPLHFMTKPEVEKMEAFWKERKYGCQ